jgi:DtxR family Mn-dependent transcriptional regulator
VIDYPLTDAELNIPLTVSRVHTHDADKLAYLGELGLKPGTNFTLIARAPFNGPIQLRVNGASDVQVIGHELAGVLRVCEPDQFDF